MPPEPVGGHLAVQPAGEREFAIKTYRYLRIGMVGVVVLLAVSLAIERRQVSCWQTSISAYYYTPVRSVFVGGLIAIGLSLIVIKGSTRWEDALLNFAGMLAPVVAFVPTSDVGRCWSVTPVPLPTGDDGTLARWVVANIDNNIGALLIAGFVGLVAAAGIAAVAGRNPLAAATVGPADQRLGLQAAFVVLVAGAALHRWWDDFPNRSHTIAAVGMFTLLAAAIASNAWQRRGRRERRQYRWIYAGIAAAMLGAGVVMAVFLRDWDHMVLWLEGIEITLFAAFWLVQTIENWNEPPRPVHPGAPAGADDGVPAVA